MEPRARRDCHFVGHDGPLSTAIYDHVAMTQGTAIAGPAVVTTRATTYLVEPGWTLRVAPQGAAWFIRDEG
jgi:N-methylhydantoinase A